MTARLLRSAYPALYVVMQDGSRRATPTVAAFSESAAVPCGSWFILLKKDWILWIVMDHEGTVSAAPPFLFEEEP